MKPSKAFIFILVGLLAVRVALKSYLSQSIDLAELSGMFFLLAFAMIVSWRIAMYRSFTKLEDNKQSWNFYRKSSSVYVLLKFFSAELICLILNVFEHLVMRLV